MVIHALEAARKPFDSSIAYLKTGKEKLWLSVFPVR